MEKLIELLNEYEKKSEVHWYEWYGKDVLMCRYIIVKDGFEFYTDEATTIAISKYYGFIRWLVENDKIDYLQLTEDNTWNILKENGGDNKTSLLMLLSISNSPIDDLISYLK